MILTIALVIFIISALMTLHEFGHFILAKRFGVPIEEFGIGYPPRLFGKKIGETMYSLNLIPFGAFVRIDEQEDEDPRAFGKKPIWQRALVLLGGIVSFWVIAAILLSIAFGTGTIQAISDDQNHSLVNPRVQIMAVAPDSPAKEAGLKMGDAIIKVQSLKSEAKSIGKVGELIEFIDSHKGEEVSLTIQRGKEVFGVSLTPRVSPPQGEGAMGVTLVRTKIVQYPWWQAPLRGIEATLNNTWWIIYSLTQAVFKVVRGVPSGLQLTGPVGVGLLMTQAVQLGMSYFLQFIAMISLHLAIFNLLPIPAVDGGRLLFLGIEKIRGRAVDPKIERGINSLSFTLLLGLMTWVTIKDIMNLF